MHSDDDGEEDHHNSSAGKKKKKTNKHVAPGLIFLADCKASEVKEFTAEYLEKVLEPSGWQAIWCTNAFEVLVEVSITRLCYLFACFQAMEQLMGDLKKKKIKEKALMGRWDPIGKASWC